MSVQRQNRVVFGLLIAGLAMAALSFFAGVLNGVEQRSASRSQVEVVLQLTEDVQRLEQLGNADVAEHRVANQADHDRDHRNSECVQRLLVMLLDPTRPKDVPPQLPKVCEDTAAALEAAEPQS